ncbi:MAG: glycosyltransferase family 2 protein [Victivallales bacterium]|nr:glycosyltransferase family 2 protein [Victivallales bacterium]
MLITLVVNCYNRADMVRTALDSVWNQTYRPIELIIVDDESQDNTMEVVEQWRAEHPDTNDFTSIAKTFPNGKPSLARNRGLALAHGDYIQFIDDDDWIYPNAVQAKVDYIKTHPDCQLIVNQLDYYRNGKNFNVTHISLPEKPQNIVEHLLHHECLLVATLMFKTDVMRAIGGWTVGLSFGEDMEITMRHAILGGTIGLVEQSLGVYRFHAETPSQCATYRSLLPDDFIVRFYNHLLDLAVQHGCDSQINREAFAWRIRQDGADQISRGRFNCARLCFQAADVIANHSEDARRWNDFSVPLSWHLKALRRKLKNFIKSIIKAKT